MTFISRRAVLECKRVVADSIRNLRLSEANLKDRLDKLNSKCHGTQFNNIKADVDKNLVALQNQVQQLEKKISKKLDEILAWLEKGKRL
jgi:hypothetical protein